MKPPAAGRHTDIATSRSADVENAFTDAAREMGGLGGLVNAAAIEEHIEPQDITDDAWNRMMSINIGGTFLTNQAAFHEMRERGGKILNFGSDAGLIAYPSATHYSASKGAVTSWTRSIAASWGRFGITANTIAPAMWTPMYDQYRAHLSAEALIEHDAMMAQLIAIGGKLGDPARDLVPVIVFLLSPASNFITGQIICKRRDGLYPLSAGSFGSPNLSKIFDRPLLAPKQGSRRVGPVYPRNMHRSSIIPDCVPD